MSAERVSRGARRFVAAGALSLVAWQLAVLMGTPRRTQVVLGLFGFVLLTIFGKAYALVPSHFERELTFPRAPAIQLPLSVVGVIGLAVAPVPGVPSIIGVIDATAWMVGVVLFLGAIFWMIRDNLLGRETGTGSGNIHRERVDRIANAFVPVVLAYLLVGSTETLVAAWGWPRLVSLAAAETHLLAAGTAALLLFTIGFRLLPRFLVSIPPWPLVMVVLLAGALGPALIAVDFYGEVGFRVGAFLQATAVFGFAAAYGVLFYRTDRDRVGFYGPLAGMAIGVLGVLLGLGFAFGMLAPIYAPIHLRLMVLGFLGLSIMGVAYQFYPPAVGTFPGVADRTALASTALVSLGLLVEGAGAWTAPVGVFAGRLLALVGTMIYAVLLFGLFHERYG